MVATTVRPERASECVSVVTTCAAVYASRPEVGSSTKSTDGLVTSSAPMLTRLRSPPETPPAAAGSPIIVSAVRSRCSVWITDATSLSRAAAEVACGSRSAAENVSTSRTVCVDIIKSSCVTKTVARRKAALVAVASSCPLTRISPLSVPSWRRPARQLSSVVLPAPLLPMTASSLPGDAWPQQSCRMIFSPSAVRGASRSRLVATL